MTLLNLKDIPKLTRVNYADQIHICSIGPCQSLTFLLDKVRSQYSI